MNRTIVITGMGAVTPVGIGMEKYWQGLLDGVCGIRDWTDPETGAVYRAGQVSNYRSRDYFSSRLAGDLDRFTQFACLAGEEAWRDGGLDPDPSRTGVVMGTALAGLSLIGETQRSMDREGRQAPPRLMAQVMGNMAASQFAVSHDLHGPNLTVTTACASGGDALTMAALLLQVGAADAMVVLAGESSLHPLFLQSLTRAGALSPTGNSRPFDKARDGFVVGEGGGALLLEREDAARRRGACIHARLLGWANNNDGFHAMAPQPEGRWTSACMEQALAQAGLTPAEIGYVNAHGTATVKGDLAEAKALRHVFGDLPVPISATKGNTGHMMGAGGLTEVIACIKALETGLLPAGIGCEDPEALGLNLLRAGPMEKPIATAMSNAFGFGGQNSSIVVGRA